MENLYTPDCIRTFSGLYLNVLDPQPEQICIEDIAHGLSNICRFAGHTQVFYSVAHHSLEASYRVGTSYMLAALLHDASEAYLGDIPSPIKKHLPDYQALEAKFMKVIADKFGFKYPLDPVVCKVDRLLLQMEWDATVINNTWESDDREQIEKNFLLIYKLLTKNR